MVKHIYMDVNILRNHLVPAAAFIHWPDVDAEFYGHRCFSAGQTQR